MIFDIVEISLIEQVSKTLTITKLAEHHRKQLVPTGEVLHVAIAIILANEACSHSCRRQDIP